MQQLNTTDSSKRWTLHCNFYSILIFARISCYFYYCIYKRHSLNIQSFTWLMQAASHNTTLRPTTSYGNKDKTALLTYSSLTHGVSYNWYQLYLSKTSKSHQQHFWSQIFFNLSHSFKTSHVFILNTILAHICNFFTFPLEKAKIIFMAFSIRKNTFCTLYIF